MLIHPTAIIEPGAEIDPTAEIGPYAIIEGPCRIGARTRVMPHAVVGRWTEIGEDNILHFGAVVGHQAQHLANQNEERWTRIGNRNIFRENVTVHRAHFENSQTTIGDNCMFMAGAHVAHDCHIGSNVVIVNNVMLGGHVEIEDNVFVGGGSGVHQFVRLGRLAMVAGVARVTSDVPPFMTVAGMSRIRALNVVGLRRASITPETRKAIKQAYQLLYHSGLTIPRALETISGNGALCPEVQHLVDFVAASKRGICGHYRRGVTEVVDD